jgi:DNA-binding CsgD family transcriptional regulator
MLTPKEMLCLSGVARHLQADEIARELGLSPKTVETHLANIRKKLGVSSSRVAVRRVFGESLQTEPVEGFSSIPQNEDHLHADLLNGGGWYAEDHQTSAGMVYAGLVASDRAQRAERHEMGGSGDRGRHADLQSGEAAKAQAPRQGALVGEHRHADNELAPAAFADNGEMSGPESIVRGEGWRIRHSHTGEWADAAMELHGSGGRPVLHLVGSGAGNSHSPSSRLSDVSGRPVVGGGNGTTVDAAGLRAPHSERAPVQGRNRSTPEFGQGGLTPELLFRTLVLMGSILGLTILALALLTVQNFSLWLQNLLFQ